MTLLKSAIEYSERFNYPVIPVNPQDKKPLIKWLEFQNRKATKEEIESWWGKWPNAMIGGVTGKISGDFVIDIDGPQGDEALIDYIPDTLLVPTSKTPRGGKHLHFENPEEELTVRAGIFPHVDYRGEHGYIVMPPSKNSEGKQYLWLEGLSLSDLPRPQLPQPLLIYIKEFASSLYRESDEVTQSHKMFKKGTRDDDLFHIANQLSISKTPQWQIQQVLEILARNCNPPFPLKEIQTKIQSALDRADRKDINIFQDLKFWAESQDGFWKVSEYHSESQMVTKQQKHAVIQALKRLQEQSVIEKHGNQRGFYRTIEAKADEIDFMNVEEKVMEILWPFEIEQWVKILPKNIVIVAGEANAGKTAFLLNVCLQNMGKFKINYFSSEMGAMELRDRLKKFEVNLQHWKENINFRERSTNFSDVVKPNDVNIIDFLEITDEFYKVGGMIKEIYDKLKKGIAIIALQKNPGTDYGLGGMRSIEKARLYLSMGDNKIKVVKGKNWASEVNPNGIYRNFKLIQGAKFIPREGWKKD